MAICIGGIELATSFVAGLLIGILMMWGWTKIKDIEEKE